MRPKRVAQVTNKMLRQTVNVYMLFSLNGLHRRYMDGDTELA